MGIINGMGDLLQAQMSIKSANMMHNIQIGMNNEKQTINTEIMLDGHSTSAKDNRLDQISNQTTKINSYFSKSIQTAQQQIIKAQHDQQDSTKDTDNHTENKTINSTESSKTVQPDSDSNNDSQDGDVASSKSQNVSQYTINGDAYVDSTNTNVKLDVIV